MIKSNPTERQRLVDSGKYTEALMSKAEKIFWDTQPTGAPKTAFETWLETSTAPTQSYFYKLAQQGV